MVTEPGYSFHITNLNDGLHGGGHSIFTNLSDKSVSTELLNAIEELKTLSADLEDSFPDVACYFDLGELRGYHYHTGVVFAVYKDGYAEPIAKGGRYDHIGESFGRARPATGFSADLKTLLTLSPAAETART